MAKVKNLKVQPSVFKQAAPSKDNLKSITNLKKNAKITFWYSNKKETTSLIEKLKVVFKKKKYSLFFFPIKSNKIVIRNAPGGNGYATFTKHTLVLRKGLLKFEYQDLNTAVKLFNEKYYFQTSITF